MALKRHQIDSIQRYADPTLRALEHDHCAVLRQDSLRGVGVVALDERHDIISSVTLTISEDKLGKTGPQRSVFSFDNVSYIATLSDSVC